VLAEESALILIRHGESLWNSKNLFTGCVDVPLSQKGVDEAIEAGKRISELPVDMIFTSALIRAQMTAMLAMTQHHRQKVSPSHVSLPNHLRFLKPHSGATANPSRRGPTRLCFRCQ
jgi:bisphosphoglycerate-dependent phosphoglycerate mutase